MGHYIFIGKFLVSLKTKKQHTVSRSFLVGVGKKSNFHDPIYFFSYPIHLISILLKIQSI